MCGNLQTLYKNLVHFMFLSIIVFVTAFKDYHKKILLEVDFIVERLKGGKDLFVGRCHAQTLIYVKIKQGICKNSTFLVVSQIRKSGG